MDEIGEYLERRQPSPLARLRCTDCEQTFADRLPAIDEDMPECPHCGSGPVQLLELLEPVAG